MLLKYHKDFSYKKKTKNITQNNKVYRRTVCYNSTNDKLYYTVIMPTGWARIQKKKKKKKAACSQYYEKGNYKDIKKDKRRLCVHIKTDSPSGELVLLIKA